MTQNSVTIHQENYSITIRIVNPPDSNIPAKQTFDQLISAEHLIRAAIKDIHDSVNAAVGINRFIEESPISTYWYMYPGNNPLADRWFLREFIKDIPHFRVGYRCKHHVKPSDGHLLCCAATDQDDSVLIFEISSDNPLTNGDTTAVSLKEFLGEAATTYFTSTVDDLMNFLQTEDI